jgi:AcrR family transcriptional regulator
VSETTPARPHPAPRLTGKGRATRDRIVSAAADLMYVQGVSGTSLEEVRAAAEVSSSQIYHYFADKKALTRAVIEHQTRLILDLQAPLLTRLDSIEALEAWRDAVLGIQHQHGCQGGCPIGSLAGELAETDPDCRADLSDGYRRWRTMIRDGLAAMRDRGELRADTQVDRLALAMLAALQGGLLLTQVDRTTEALEAVLTTMIERIRGQLA